MPDYAEAVEDTDETPFCYSFEQDDGESEDDGNDGDDKG